MMLTDVQLYGSDVLHLSSRYYIQIIHIDSSRLNSDLTFFLLSRLLNKTIKTPKK